MASFRKSAREQQLDEIAAQLHPEVVAHIQQRGLDNQQAELSWDYWSTVRFNTVRTGGGAPYVYTMAAAERVAFGYAFKTNPGVQAGYSSTYVASKRETNLQQPNSTRDNANVKIYGLALEIVPNTAGIDVGDLIKAVFGTAFCEISLGGIDHLVGPLSRLPAAGGLYGAMGDALRTPDVQSTYSAPQGQIVNGNPTAMNFFSLARNPLEWFSIATGKKDTALSVKFTCDRDIVLNGTTRAGADVAEHNNIQAFTPPADGSYYVDLCLHLLTDQIGGRSGNA